MKILVWSFAGGMIMGFVYDLYIRAMSESRRKTLGLIHLWEVTDWRRN
jgi:xanthosine utilization system XapX-like protein